MKKYVIMFILLLVVSNNISAQNKYKVFFKDKKGSEFDPYSYFDAKAIERRQKHNVSLYDISDFPISEKYLEEVENIVDSTGFVSRWFNFVIVFLHNDNQRQKILELDFVVKIEKQEPSKLIVCKQRYDYKLEDYKSQLMRRQINRMGGELFIKNNIDGEGVRIAIFDIGFPAVENNPIFHDINVEGRIKNTFDFKRKNENVFRGATHGTATLACVGGKIDSNTVGLATGADFLLAITEGIGEHFCEEEYWLGAMEWAEKNGADIISSSLGYTYHRYFRNRMDGQTSLVVKAANMAAKKGILVVNSIGNNGSDKWKTMGTPADGDSVLSVGGINPDTDFRIKFSSYGPTATQKMKPNLSAYGRVITAGRKGFKIMEGTSFSAPLVSGFAACVLQKNPNLKAMELFRELEKSGHLYPYFDYVHGFGIPQAAYFLDSNYNKKNKTFEILQRNDSIVVKIIKNTKNKLAEATNERLLFYNIMRKNGVLKKYVVVEANSKEPLQLKKSILKQNETINVYYKGYVDKFRRKD